jgi:hypothetical protein
MRYAAIIFIAVAFGLPLAVPAGEAPKKDEFSELSRLLHKLVVKQVPREHEEKIGWGTSIPIPPKLLAPGLKRMYVKVGDRQELAHGAWKRILIKLDDPDRDLRIRVKEFKKGEKGTYRVVIDSEAPLRCYGELNQWLRGLLLARVDGQADATIATTMVCDVNVALNVKKFPPEVSVDPKVVEMTLDLRDFNLKQVTATVQGVRIEGEALREKGNEVMPDLIRAFMKASEPIVKDYANQAIAESLKEGKGKLSASELLKATPK